MLRLHSNGHGRLGLKQPGFSLQVGREWLRFQVQGEGVSTTGVTAGAKAATNGFRKGPPTGRECRGGGGGTDQGLPTALVSTTGGVAAKTRMALKRPVAEAEEGQQR